jgi:uncharacterized protein YbjT (DUF2867 family)
MILVTGATGNLSFEVARQLAQQGVPFRGLVHSPQKGAAVEQLGGEAVVGDFDDPASLDRALVGVEKAFLLTPPEEPQSDWERNFVDAALRSGLRHLVYLSMRDAVMDSPTRLARSHAITEEYVRQVGLPFTFLRPNSWMENILAFIPTIVRQGVFFSAIGDAPVSYVAVADIAASAVAALTGDGHEGRTYDLTGPEALTFWEVSDVLSIVTGRPIIHIGIPAEASKQYMLAAGLPPWRVEGLTEFYEIYLQGQAASVEPGVFEATGRQPMSFEQWARETFAKMLASPLAS